MERNSVIVERLEKSMCDRLSRTSKYNQQIDEIRKLEQELLKLVGSNKQAVKKHLSLESITNESHLEYESMCFCEGVRLGFKLCIDIFDI